MKISTGIGIIALSTLVSIVISNLPKEQDPGLGFFIFLVWPIVVGICSMILLLIVSAFTKNQKLRLLTAILLSIYLIYVGIGLYADKGWPLVYW